MVVDPFESSGFLPIVPSKTLQKREGIHYFQRDPLPYLKHCSDSQIVTLWLLGYKTSWNTGPTRHSLTIPDNPCLESLYMEREREREREKKKKKKRRREKQDSDNSMESLSLFSTHWENPERLHAIPMKTRGILEFLHSQKTTWNLKRDPFKRKSIGKQAVCRFHVVFKESTQTKSIILLEIHERGMLWLEPLSLQT